MVTAQVEQIIRDVQSLCPDADPNIARMWVRDAGRRTMEFGPWSWLLRRNQFVIPAAITNTSSGATVSFVEGSDEIEFSSGIVTEAMVGRQIRSNTSLPIYDITGYISSTKARIFPAWGTASASAQSFSIFLARLVLPADCLEILSVTSAANRWRLYLGIPQELLDGQDPSRERAGGACCLLSPLDYSRASTGIVYPIVQVTGSGPKPIAGVSYDGQNNAIFTVEITTGGVGGVAEFQWKKNEGSWTTGIVSDFTSGNSLQDSINVLFPDTSTFVDGDVFVIRASPSTSAGSARMELYPYSSTQTVLPYMYVSRYPDLTDDNVSLPGILSGRDDIIREKAMEFAATWPGTEDRNNPYNQINRRDYHAANWRLLCGELARQDNSMFQRNMMGANRLPWAPWPFGGYGNPQTYDAPFIYPDFVW